MRPVRLYGLTLTLYPEGTCSPPPRIQHVGCSPPPGYPHPPATAGTTHNHSGTPPAVRTQEKACSSNSRFRRKLSGTTGHRLLGTKRPQILCVAAWVWFCLSTEFVAAQRSHSPSQVRDHPCLCVTGSNRRTRRRRTRRRR